MKYSFALLLVTFLSCNNDKEQIVETKGPYPAFVRPKKPEIPDSLFQYHFKILDSAARYPYQDTMYHCCYDAINFMELYTGIEADVDGDYFGTTGFKKEDLRKWHQWYDSVHAK